jgi:hypothetical protein
MARWHLRCDGSALSADCSATAGSGYSRRIRKHWPTTSITIRGDGHYGRPEIMEWCDENGVDFIFGLPGNVVLDRLVDDTADDIRTRRALDQKPCLRGFCRDGLSGEILEDRPACLCPDRGHRQGPRHPLRGDQHRDGSAEHIYETLYCARGQAENLIKLHKAQLASDRTQLSQPARQPDAADPARRCLLAHAHRP